MSKEDDGFTRHVADVEASQTPMISIERAENITTEDGYISEFAMEDDVRGREITPFDSNRAIHRRLVEAEYRLSREKSKNKEAKRMIRSYEAQLREAQSSKRLVSDAEADHIIQELMDENKKFKVVISTLETVIQMLHDSTGRVGTSQLKNNSRQERAGQME